MEDYLSKLKEARGQLTSKEKTISIKDLTMCLRKKVFSTIDPVPMTDEELYDYVSGRAVHDVIQRLFMTDPIRFRSEVHIQFGQVRGIIDILDTWFNNIIESKLSRSRMIPLGPFKFHEKQVRYYMAIRDSNEGQIIYQLNNFATYRSFPIYLTAEDRRKELEELESKTKVLQNAIDKGDPSLAPGIYDDIELKWLCNKCAYRERCLSTRNGVREEIRNVN
jgi:CRISPR/Cas system-associated exonuclease Cas4 (RecB family)